jgi:predicted NBD/HSP70 family sugar kinase
MVSSAYAVFECIYQLQPISRRILRARTGLSANSVATAVSELLSGNLVLEAACADGSPGRPVALLSVNPAIAHIVGLDIGGGHSRAVLTDAGGRILHATIQRTEVVADPDRILDNIVGLVGEVSTGSERRLEALAALGVGVRGIVDSRTGIMLGWPNTPDWAETWRGLDLAHELRRRLGIGSIVVEDSVRAMGQVAHRLGLARGCSDFLYVFLGNGIGACLFVDGRPYAGSAGIAGELGHVTVDEDGPYCSCGNQGCLEMMASTAAVLRRVRERLSEPRLMSTLRTPYRGDQLTLDAVLRAAEAGDKLAFQVLDETGTYVGKVLAIAVNLLGPELVVLGGPLARAEGILLEAVQRQVRLHALQHVSEQTRILCDDQGQLTGAHGAALLALDALFSSEEHLARLVAAGCRG